MRHKMRLGAVQVPDVRLGTPGPAKDLKELYADAGGGQGNIQAVEATAFVCPGVPRWQGKLLACFDHKLQERTEGGELRPLLRKACATGIGPPGRAYLVCVRRVRKVHVPARGRNVRPATRTATRSGGWRTSTCTTPEDHLRGVGLIFGPL